MTLQDGSVVALRALRPQERAAVLGVFGRLGAESRRQRFLAPKPALSESDLERLTAVDGVRHDAVVAVLPGTEPVGIARFVREADDPETAEVAFAVADDFQGRGLGSKLVAAIAARAAAAGVRRLRATVLAENGRSLALVRRLGRVIESRREGATVELVVELGS